MSEAIKPYPYGPRRRVPKNIAIPPFCGTNAREEYDGPDIMSAEIIEKMRLAGKIAANALAEAGKAVAPGVTTDRLDEIAHEYLCDHQAYPSCLDYQGFPKSICTSVNEVICHGIPDKRPLADGDIVKIDVTAYFAGVNGDTCATFLCGDVQEPARLLVERTRNALNRGIQVVAPGRQINVIGQVIENYASRFNYGVVRSYTGHGVHTAFHSGLVVPHYDSPFYNTVMQPGMTFTIEPMLVLGEEENETWSDGWTVVTKDKSWCAQFEHTLVVTNTGAEILTLPQ